MATSDPRANQKHRTRAAIVEAAARLMRNGVAPSVADAAKEAKVSRATAYRYFPTPEALQLEAAGVTPAYAPLEASILAGLEGDAEERLAQMISKLNAAVFADEAQMRMALKVYLDTWFASGAAGGSAPPLREGRRMRWLDAALAPERKALPKKRWRRLQAALALATGPDAMVVMKDVCGMSDREAQETLLWAAKALLRAGLDDE
jgi:AcrR family transcriptional regulator